MDRGASVFFSVILVLFLLFISCSSGKKIAEPKPKKQIQESAKKTEVVEREMVALKAKEIKEETALQRLNQERKLKRIVDNAQFVVSIKVAGSFICTGFLVDRRGYFLTSRHCLNNFFPGAKLSLVFLNGEEYPTRVVEDIQTLDMSLLSSDKSFELPTPEFLDSAEMAKNGKSLKDGNAGLDKRIVAIPCRVKSDPPAKENIVYLGEISRWESDKKISFLQLQQNTSGCSGAPVMDSNGKIIGMLRSRSGDIVYAIADPSLKDAISAIIIDDILARNKK